MAEVRIPAGTDIALALREPSLLVPGNKHIGNVELKREHKLSSSVLNLFPFLNVGGRPIDFADNSLASITGSPTFNKSFYNNGTGTDYITAKNKFSGLSKLSVVFRLKWNSTSPFAGGNGILSAYTGFSPLQMLFWRKSSNIVSFRIYTSAGNATADASAGISDLNEHVYIATWDGSTIRFYIDGTLQSSPSLGGTINVNSSNFRIGQYDSIANIQATINETVILNHVLSAEDVAMYSRANYLSLELLKPADNSPILYSVAAGGAAYSETIASSVTSSAVFAETYNAPAYSEVIVSSVTSSATFAETYGPPGFVEVLASSVTASATFAETYGAPAYSEVISSAVTSAAQFLETFESGTAYQEVIASAATSSATFAETYGAPSYSEIIASSVISSGSFSETFSTPAALPTILELTAVALPGYSARSLDINKRIN